MRRFDPDPRLQCFHLDHYKKDSLPLPVTVITASVRRSLYSFIGKAAMRDQRRNTTMTTLAPAKITFEHILVPTDFSDVSQRALDYAGDIAKQCNSDLLLAHVEEPVNPVAPPEAVWMDVEEIRRIWERQLQAEGAELRTRGLKAEAVCVTGAVHSEVLALVQEREIDLIVMGTHGRTGLDRLFFGSDTEAVLRHVRCPVVVIGPEVATAPKPAWPPKHMICATTLDPDTAPVAAYAFQLAQEHHAEFTLFNVDNSLDLNTSDDWTGFEAAFRKSLPAGIVPGDPLHTFFGNTPGNRIVDLAKERNADLIVMGAEAAPMITTHFARGTVAKVFTEAPCPVMTLHLE